MTPEQLDAQRLLISLLDSRAWTTDFIGAVLEDPHFVPRRELTPEEDAASISHFENSVRDAFQRRGDRVLQTPGLRESDHEEVGLLPWLERFALRGTSGTVFFRVRNFYIGRDDGILRAVVITGLEPSDAWLREGLDEGRGFVWHPEYELDHTTVFHAEDVTTTGYGTSTSRREIRWKIADGEFPSDTAEAWQEKLREQAESQQRPRPGILRDQEQRGGGRGSSDRGPAASESFGPARALEDEPGRPRAGASLPSSSSSRPGKRGAAPSQIGETPPTVDQRGPPLAYNLVPMIERRFVTQLQQSLEPLRPAPAEGSIAPRHREYAPDIEALQLFRDWITLRPKVKNRRRRESRRQKPGAGHPGEEPQPLLEPMTPQQKALQRVFIRLLESARWTVPTTRPATLGDGAVNKGETLEEQAEVWTQSELLQDRIEAAFDSYNRDTFRNRSENHDVPGLRGLETLALGGGFSGGTVIFGVRNFYYDETTGTRRAVVMTGLKPRSRDFAWGPEYEVDHTTVFEAIDEKYRAATAGSEIPPRPQLWWKSKPGEYQSAAARELYRARREEMNARRQRGGAQDVDHSPEPAVWVSLPDHGGAAPAPGPPQRPVGRRRRGDLDEELQTEAALLESLAAVPRQNVQNRWQDVCDSDNNVSDSEKRGRDSGEAGGAAASSHRATSRRASPLRRPLLGTSASDAGGGPTLPGPSSSSMPRHSARGRRDPTGPPGGQPPS
ncbi:unnamed protein product [Amoebophrya sp. A120]|nr:unnamed protein product [Amoebophrya sp. A120]|eukprot:GSA120T00019625001.1